jgi:hypothetical protein
MDNRRDNAAVPLGERTDFFVMKGIGQRQSGMYKAGDRYDALTK